MTVKDLIVQLLDYPQTASVIIQKEIDFNIWINSDIKIKKDSDKDVVVLDFDFSKKILDRLKEK